MTPVKLRFQRGTASGVMPRYINKPIWQSWRINSTESNYTSYTILPTRSPTSTQWQGWYDSTYDSTYTTSTITLDPWQWDQPQSAWPEFEPAVNVWRDVHFQKYNMTEEERAKHLAAQAARQAEQDRLAEERAAAEMAAEIKAEALLLGLVGDDEVKRWRERREIHVRSQHGRRYCIVGTHRQHNIFELDESDRRVKELCVHTARIEDGHVPLSDNVIAQMLALQHAEDHLLQEANVWDLRDLRRLVGRAEAPLFPA